MGILRLAEVQSDVNLVKVWATPAGIVLCASDKFRDWFGTPSSEVIGKNVNTLSTEPEAMDRCELLLWVSLSLEVLLLSIYIQWSSQVGN